VATSLASVRFSGDRQNALPGTQFTILMDELEDFGDEREGIAVLPAAARFPVA
jgi:hypothetical protein